MLAPYVVGPLHSLPQFVLGVGGTSQMPGLSGEGANDIGRLKKEAGENARRSTNLDDSYLPPEGPSKTERSSFYADVRPAP